MAPCRDIPSTAVPRKKARVSKQRSGEKNNYGRKNMEKTVVLYPVFFKLHISPVKSWKLMNSTKLFVVTYKYISFCNRNYVREGQTVRRTFALGGLTWPLWVSGRKLHSNAPTTPELLRPWRKVPMWKYFWWLAPRWALLSWTIWSKVFQILSKFVDDIGTLGQQISCCTILQDPIWGTK